MLGDRRVLTGRSITSFQTLSSHHQSKAIDASMRVLLVEDSERLRESLRLGLAAAGFAVDEAGDGRQGMWLSQNHPYDVIILDRMLPQLDGLELLSKLRAGGCQSGILMLTARDRLQDKVDGLHAGADDYLVKPFAFEELLARIGALVRRKHLQSAPFVSLGDIRIDFAARSVTRGAERLNFSSREYAVLEYLAMRRGHIVSRTDIEAHVYGQESELMSNVVDTVVYSLRRKLDVPGFPSMICTHRGMGYEMLSTR